MADLFVVAEVPSTGCISRGLHGADTLSAVQQRHPCSCSQAQVSSNMVHLPADAVFFAGQSPAEAAQIFMPQCCRIGLPSQMTGVS